jgi:Tol biopolymer transport system component
MNASMRVFPRRNLGSHCISAAAFLALTATAAEAQYTRRVSVTSTGLQGNQGGAEASMTPDGRHVAFSSASTNLVPVDLNGKIDVFVRDLEPGVTEIVSVSSSGAQANDQSSSPTISADGRFVAFYSNATNLDPAHPAPAGQIYVRDRQLQTTELVSGPTTGPTAGTCFFPSISADGRFVAFTSDGALLLEDTNGIEDVYVRDRLNGTTECVSVPTGPPQTVDTIPIANLSADGRFVAFSTAANNILPGVTGPSPSVFLRDRTNGNLELLSIDLQGNSASGDSTARAISADGRFVVFSSNSADLVVGDSNGRDDVFVRDRQLGTTERVSVDGQGNEGDDDSGGFCAITPDGRDVVFTSTATNLVPGDTNVFVDVFLRDRSSGSTERVSLTSAGYQGGGGGTCSVSDDGRLVAFSSTAHLVPGDTNQREDVFIRDRTGGPTFTSLCSPGIDGVRTCPCGNPPSGPDRGCDNSSSTGGATLSAMGGSFVSSDSLEFRVDGEKPSALSVLFQGTLPLASGVVNGQGVRCVAGTTRRLFTKHAAAGSLVVPEFAVGDTTVTRRSAELGDPIQPSGQRWYAVYYRDPTVLGGCPATSTFNSTQTGRIDWGP